MPTYQRTSPLPFDSFRRNGNIGGGLHEGPRSDCDIDFQNISSLSTCRKSRPTHPVPASSWFCSLDTRDIPTTVSGSGDANPGVWPAGVFALPTTRHRPDGAPLQRFFPARRNPTLLQAAIVSEGTRPQHVDSLGRASCVKVKRPRIDGFRSVYRGMFAARKARQTWSVKSGV